MQRPKGKGVPAQPRASCRERSPPFLLPYEMQGDTSAGLFQPVQLESLEKVYPQYLSPSPPLSPRQTLSQGIEDERTPQAVNGTSDLVTHSSWKPAPKGKLDCRSVSVAGDFTGWSWRE